ncbi:MAG: hypothetical protein WDN46_05110 [Methylocella sp.]
MSVIADLATAGVDPNLIAKVAIALADAERRVGEAEGRAAEAKAAIADRREKDAVRKRKSRDVTGSHVTERDGADVTGQGSSPVPSDGSPKDNNQTPSLPPQTPSPIPSSASAERELSLEFEHEFWLVYPNKVGKPVALKSWVKARRIADLETILGGLGAYLAKTDDRPWCNPATWLNQERWKDRPAAVPRAGPKIPPQNNRNVYLGVDKQKQLIDEIFDRREAEYGQPSIAGLLER